MVLFFVNIINNPEYHFFCYLQVNIDLVVQDNNNCQRHDVLENAREHGIPDSVLSVKGISIVPILGK